MTTEHSISRRQWLAGAAAFAAAAPLPGQQANPPNPEPFRLGLNTSTLFGQKLPITQVVEVASRAGFQAIEPWTRELEAHLKNGGTLRDLGKRIQDSGLTVESVIGFFEWIVDDEERRRRAMEQARRDMDMVLQIGGRRIAAPPSGATNQANLDLAQAALRYRALLEIGEKIGVVPQLELWGFSRALSRLGECAQVAIDSGHPQACILLDVYHIYKGGNRFDSIRLLNGSAIHVIHFNDYPAAPPRAEITDAHRVYPGDGVAPLRTFLRDLRQIGFRGTLTLELFNRDYWQRDALAVARTGLEKMRAAVKSSME
jgi:sugar phosphate isomerase/epimerase